MDSLQPPAAKRARTAAAIVDDKALCTPILFSGGGCCGHSLAGVLLFPAVPTTFLTSTCSLSSASNVHAASEKGSRVGARTRPRII